MREMLSGLSAGCLDDQGKEQDADGRRERTRAHLVGQPQEQGAARLLDWRFAHVRQMGVGPPAFRSNHAVLWASLTTPGPQATYVCRDRLGGNYSNLKGWAPTGEAHLQDVKRETCEQLKVLLEPTNGELAESNLSEKFSRTEEIIATPARLAGTGAGTNNEGRMPRCPNELIDLERQATQEGLAAEEKSEVRKKARRLRRHWLAHRAEWRSRHAKDGQNKVLITDQRGDPVRNTQRCSADLLAHCAAKYAEEASEASNDDLLGEVNHPVTAMTNKPEAAPQWTWEVTIQARASLSRQKSTGRGEVSAGSPGPLGGSLVGTSRDDELSLYACLLQLDIVEPHPVIPAAEDEQARNLGALQRHVPPQRPVEVVHGWCDVPHSALGGAASGFVLDFEFALRIRSRVTLRRPSHVSSGLGAIGERMAVPTPRNHRKHGHPPGF